MSDTQILNIGDTYAGMACVWTVEAIYFNPPTVLLSHPLADGPWALDLVDFGVLVERDLLTLERAGVSIPEVALALWGDGEDRDFDLADVQVWYRRRNDVYLPVVDTACFVCHTHAEPGHQGVSVSRISGDSRYGYESYHTACI